MSEDESGYTPGMFSDPGSAIIADKLAEQLGTDPIVMGLGAVDMRRLTVIEKEQMGLIMYATIRAQKSRAWETILEVVKNWGVSVGGRGRRDIIRMQAVSRGGAAAVESEIIRPGWGARNIYERDWEKQERERLGLE